MSEQDNDRLDDDASHETDRHTESQPPREDIIPVDELEDLEAGEADPTVSEDDAVLPRPASEDLPESQGVDVDQGERMTEDAADRPRLSDEEL